jgi:hypothetical protein
VCERTFTSTPLANSAVDIVGCASDARLYMQGDVHPEAPAPAAATMMVVIMNVLRGMAFIVAAAASPRTRS